MVTAQKYVETVGDNTQASLIKQHEAIESDLFSMIRMLMNWRCNLNRELIVTWLKCEMVMASGKKTQMHNLQQRYDKHKEFQKI